MTLSTSKSKHVRLIKTLILMLIFGMSIVSAQNIKWGIGISTNVHLFYHSNNKLYANSVFRPIASRTYGIGLKREIASKGRFKTQVNLNCLKKIVSIGEKKRNYTQTIDYDFFSADLGVNVFYNNPESKYNLRPFVGLSLPFSFFTGAVYREKTKFLSTRSGFNIHAVTPDESHKWFLYPCLNLGVSKFFHLRKGRHFWDTTLSTQLSPAPSFSNLQVPSPTNDVQLLAGNLHGISLAISRFF